MSEPELFVVSGPSGAGKSTLVRRLLASVPDLDFSVSWTTRPARAGETEGVDYHFVDDAEFDRREKAGEFLEWARVHGRRYGTSARDVEKSLASGRDILLDVDTQGARSVRARRPDAVLVFILPPGKDALVSRLRGRRLESADEVEKRLRNAVAEIRQGNAYDYLIVNDDVDRALAALQGIVVAHRARAPRQAGAWRGILESFEAGQINAQEKA